MDFRAQLPPGPPVYVQLANWLSARIQSGCYAVNERLPSERTLAAITGVARGTVKQAYQQLERRGQVRIVPGGGVYVLQTTQPADAAPTALVQTVIAQLRAGGLNRSKMTDLGQACARARLTKDERPQLAWIDCCTEMLLPIAHHIETACGYTVTALLLDDIMADPLLLIGERFHTIATSVVHYDDVTGALAGSGKDIERIALSLTPQTIRALTAIKTDDRVAVLRSSHMFSYGVGKYLTEFGIETQPDIIPVARAEQLLFTWNAGYQWLILPPDDMSPDNTYRQIADQASAHGIRTFHLRHIPDNHSLGRLKARMFV